MIRLRRTFTLGAVDAPRFVAVLPPLLQCLRDLKFGDDGIVETADGRALEGLQVTDGTHPRPHTSYRIVTRQESATPEGVEPGVRTVFAEYAAELVADDARMFQVRAQEYGGNVEVLLTLPDPRRPTRVDLELYGVLDGPWPVRAPITGSATISLNEFPPAHSGKPQLNATFRHRRVAGRAEVTVTPDTGARWLVTIDIRTRLRGIFRLAAPFSRIIRTKLQKVLDEMDPQALADFDKLMKATQERFGPSPDPSMMATAALDALLAGVAEVVPPVEAP